MPLRTALTAVNVAAHLLITRLRVLTSSPRYSTPVQHFRIADMMGVQRPDRVAQQAEPLTVGKSARRARFHSSDDGMSSMLPAFTNDEDRGRRCQAGTLSSCAAGNGSDALLWTMLSHAISQSLLPQGQDARIAGN